MNRYYCERKANEVGVTQQVCCSSTDGVLLSRSSGAFLLAFQRSSPLHIGGRCLVFQTFMAEVQGTFFFFFYSFSNIVRPLDVVRLMTAGDFGDVPCGTTACRLCCFVGLFLAPLLRVVTN